MNTHNNYLLTKTKKELIRLAKLHGMSGYSSLNKESLAQRLLEYLYTPSVIHNFFVYLGDDELRLIHSPDPDHPALYRRMYEGGYCFKDADGQYQITPQLKDFSMESCEESFKKTFETSFGKSFEKERQSKSFLLDCLNASGHLYGCFPVSVLMKMYNTHAPAPLKREEILQEIQTIPPYFQCFLLEKDLIIQKDLYANDLYKKIQQCQGTLPFYMPDKKEIIHLSRFGYFPEDQYTGQLSGLLADTAKISREQAEELSGSIQTLFRQGGTIEDAVTFLQKYAESKENPDSKISGSKTSNSMTSSECSLGQVLESGIAESSGRRLLSALNNVFSHTALLLGRGHTAAEVVKLRKKRTKIYPNSPCPCGSGKKYKNCCGRR